MSEILWIMYFLVAVCVGLAAYTGYHDAIHNGDVGGRKWMVIFGLMSPVWPILLVFYFIAMGIEKKQDAFRG